MINHSIVYDFIAKHAPTYQWGAEIMAAIGPKNLSARVTAVPEPGGLLHALRATFPVDALVAAGVCKRVTTDSVDTGRIDLIPHLAAVGSPLLSIQPAPDKMPFTLVTDGGCPGYGLVPLRAALSDHTVKRRIRGGLPLFVAFSAADTAALLALGLPATTATDLANLHGDKLTQVCGALMWRRGLDRQAQASAMAATRPGPEICFVAWQPSIWRSEQPTGCAAVIRHWSELRTALHIEVPQARLWRPSAKDLEEIAFVARHGNASELAGKLAQSYVSYSYVAFPELVPTKPAEPSLSTAYSAVFNPPAHQTNDAREKALKDLDAALERALYGPLAQQINDTADPVRRVQLSALATMIRLYHQRTTPALVELAKQSPRERSWLTTDEQSLDVLPLMKLVSAIFNASKQLAA